METVLRVHNLTGRQTAKKKSIYLCLFLILSTVKLCEFAYPWALIGAGRGVRVPSLFSVGGTAYVMSPALKHSETYCGHI